MLRGLKIRLFSITDELTPKNSEFEQAKLSSITDELIDVCELMVVESYNEQIAISKTCKEHFQTPTCQ